MGVKLSHMQRDGLRALCLQAIEEAEGSRPGRSHVIPLVIPFPGEPFERAVELEVQARPEDFTS